jgi:hypothetical protein
VSLLAEEDRDGLSPFFALPSFPADCIITPTEGLVRSELWNFGYSAHHAARSLRRRRNTPGGRLIARIAALSFPSRNLSQSFRPHPPNCLAIVPLPTQTLMGL